jgi:hypothetical protein
MTPPWSRPLDRVRAELAAVGRVRREKDGSPAPPARQPPSASPATPRVAHAR